MSFSPSDLAEPESSTKPAAPDQLHASEKRSMATIAPTTGPGRETHDQVTGTRAYISDPSPIRLGDLAYAASLSGASERMLGQPNLASLWPVVAAEAARLVPAHAVAIGRYSQDEWRLVAAHQHQPSPADLDLEAVINAAARHGWFREPIYINDLGCYDGAFITGRLPGAGWGSLLVVSVACPHNQDPTRLLWLSRQRGAFGGFIDVAEIFSWHISAALRDTISRETLNYAIAARNRIGQAQGILMTRHHLTADQAFEALRHQSQSTNVKLCIIAERIINGGQLDQSQSRSLTRRP
jgi:ANTAR domain